MWHVFFGISRKAMKWGEVCFFLGGGWRNVVFHALIFGELMSWGSKIKTWQILGNVSIKMLLYLKKNPEHGTAE